MNQSSHTGEEIINRKEYEKVFDFYDNHLTTHNIAKDLGVKWIQHLLFVEFVLIGTAIIIVYSLAIYLVQLTLIKYLKDEFLIILILASISIILSLALVYPVFKIYPKVGFIKLKKLTLALQEYIDPLGNHKKIDWDSKKKYELFYQYRKKKLYEFYFYKNDDPSKILNLIGCSDYFVEKSKPSKLKWPTFLLSIVLSILGQAVSIAISMFDKNFFQLLFQFIQTYIFYIVIISIFFCFFIYGIFRVVYSIYFMYLSSKHETHKSLQNFLIEMYNDKQHNQEIENIRCKILTK